MGSLPPSFSPLPATPINIPPTVPVAFQDCSEVTSSRQPAGPSFSLHEHPRTLGSSLTARPTGCCGSQSSTLDHEPLETEANIQPPQNHKTHHSPHEHWRKTASSMPELRDRARLQRGTRAEEPRTQRHSVSDLPPCPASQVSLDQYRKPLWVSVFSSVRWVTGTSTGSLSGCPFSPL